MEVKELTDSIKQLNINQFNTIFINNMNLNILSIFFLLAFLMGTSIAYSQELKINKPDLPDATIISMMRLLDSIPDELLTNYGIKNKDEIKKSAIGNPIAVYTIEKDSLSFTDTWRVPLIIDNEYRALFTVIINSDNKYQVVDYGAVLLAESLYNFSKDNVLLAMLRVYELRKDYFICGNKNAGYIFHSISNLDKRQYSLNELIKMTK